MKGYFKIEGGTTFVDIATTYKVVLFNVSGLYDTEAKEYYSYDWANEDGADVYVPTDRKVKTVPVEMRGYIYETDAMAQYVLFRDFLLSGGVMKFYDDARNLECSVVLEKMSIEVDRPREDKSFLQFKMTFTNIDGKTITHIEDEEI